MTWYDWLIVLIPLAFVMWMGFYSRKYVVQVSDFLSAGRLCGRYLICVSDVANALAIITLLGYCEMYYKSGIAWSFWNIAVTIVSIIIGLGGFFVYRFRETKAMSFGQFLEMRYSRKLRIFSAALRSVDEMLANMIMPALAARFFIYFLDLPEEVSVFGYFSIGTFHLLLVLTLSLAITLICCGGTLALVITDSIQGMICYPLMSLFVIFLLLKFSWNHEIAPVMLDRVKNQSFLNPFDISELRTFNLFFIFYSVYYCILHRGSWIGAGNTSAARTPHEQKMAGVLGAFRGELGTLFYLIIGLAVITMMTHADFAAEAKSVRQKITERISSEQLRNSPEVRDRIIRETAALPEQRHRIGVDAPLSDEKNLDTAYLNTVRNVLAEEAGPGKEAEANTVFQGFRTLYYQVMTATAVCKMLPSGLMGMFCLLMVLAMLSTDDTRIYSASLTTTQDVIMPLLKKTPTPKQHLMIVRLVAVGVGAFFFIGSTFLRQLDYINLFVATMVSMWTGGCGPMMVFGLYSRKGTTAGAWSSLLTGLVMALSYAIINRNWTDIYQFLLRHGWADGVGAFLETLSSPLDPYVRWVMDPVKCPVNAYESAVITFTVSIIVYIVVSLLTCREPFNLDRMLHRGKYNLDHDKESLKEKWTWMTPFRKLVGISNEYTTGDKVAAYATFGYNIVFRAVICFLLVIAWHTWIHPFSNEVWSQYFLWTCVVIPGIVAAVVAVWFGIGGVRDMIRLFRDLKNRKINYLDNGQVDGHMSLADKRELEDVDAPGTPKQD